MRAFNLLLTFSLAIGCRGAEQEPASTSQGKEQTYEEVMLPGCVALAKDKDAKIRKAAANALGKIGPTAIPALTELLKTRIIKCDGKPPWPWGTSVPRRGQLSQPLRNC